jgi:DNA polymerase III alpha subunit
MSFLTFEDETALYETVIFPQFYDRYNTLLFDQLLLLVHGKVCDEWEVLSIEVEKAEHIMQQIFYLTMHWTQNIQNSKPFQTSFEIRQGSQSSQ